jgi:RHS repeat-associated protein
MDWTLRRQRRTSQWATGSGVDTTTFLRSDRSGARLRRRLHAASAVATAGSLIAGLLTVAPLPAVAEPKPVQPTYPSVHGVPARAARPVRPHDDAASKWKPSAVSWPKAGHAEVRLDAIAADSDLATRGGRVRSVDASTATVKAGSLPIRVGAVAADGPSRVAVTLFDRPVAERAGVNGLLMTLASSPGADARVSSGGPLQVAIDYSTIAGAYGGDWASRLYLVSLPTCATTTPSIPACELQTPIAYRNDPAHTTLTGQVALPPGAGVTLAATSGGKGNAGDYTATPLKPSGSWAVGGNSGAFTYTYPVGAPPVPGSLAPKVALSYNSQSADGEQVASNNQPSWIGDGWSYSPGYIERSYVTCSEDPTGAAPKTSDLCWAGQILHISYGDTSADLVYDETVVPHWRLSSDDGSRVEQIPRPGNPASNGTFDGDYWRVTTRDGIQYFFGLNQLPGYGSGATATNSTWTVPVYNNPPGCGKPSCTLAWRWNLDYVVDTHHNAMAYYYTGETNYYGANKGTTGVSYVRGGWLDHIDYGLVDPTPYNGKAPARISFGVSERCTESPTVCAPANFNANKSKWPDVPGDQACDSGKPCNNHSPTFWSRKRLTDITTQIRDGAGGYAAVDSYALTQSFPATGDGTTPALWLGSIQHTGKAGTTAIPLPQVTFTATKLPNRVDTIDGAPAMNHNRVSTVTTETGEIIAVQYETGCVAPVRIDPVQNGGLCYPVYWQMEGASDKTLDWFHKYRVTEVDDQDPTGTAGPNGTRTPPVTTAYEYANAGWHFDDNELVKAKFRTYGQWRGYGVVRTRTGAGTDPKTLSEARYYLGMDGDTLPGNGRRVASVGLSPDVSVPGAAGSVPDINELAGSAREEITYNGNGGPADHATVTDYWVSPSTARRSRTGLPELTATMTGAVDVRTTTAVTATTPTTWRTTRSETSYDPTTGLPRVVYDHGDIAQPDQARCTTTSYAPSNVDANLIGLPAEVETDALPCGGSGVNGLTPPTRVNRPADVVSDTRTYYDDPRFETAWPQSTPGTSDASMVQQATDYTGGSFVYLTKTRTSYDGRGRPIGTIDAKNYATTTMYTDTGGLTTATTVTNPLDQIVKTTLDPTHGLPVTVEDPNHLVTDVRYDALGRISGVWRPGRPRNYGGSIKFSYLVSQTVPSAATTQTVNWNGQYVTTVSIVDALTRIRQTQTDTSSGGKVITDTFYDSRGWAYKTNKPYWVKDSGAPSTTVVDKVGRDQEIPTQELTTFDGLGRATSVQTNYYGVPQPDRKVTTVYGGDRTTVIPPAGGTPTTTITDALGRTTETDHYTAMPTISGSRVSGGATVKITYGYDRRGNQNSVTDDAGHIWTQTFNLLGQAVTKTDPDAGASAMTYDELGRVTTTTDSRGNMLFTAYDALGRKTGLFDGLNGQAPQLAGWTYDTASKGVGKLASATRYDRRAGGTYQYTTSTGGYDDLGNSQGVTVTVPPDPTNGKLAGTYTFANTYDSWSGLLDETDYPASEGLPAETLYRDYDPLGNMQGVTGKGAYIFNSSYGPFNQVSVSQLNNGTANQSAEARYIYNEHTGELVNARVARTASQGTPVLENIAYTYNVAGRLTSATETRNNADTETQCHQYDLLGRLTQAWTSGDVCASNVPATGDTTTVKGINPYWTSWEYNTVGDRTKQTEHALSNVAVDTATSYTYPLAGADQPNTLRSTTTTGPAGTSTTSHSYDAAGNTVTRITPDRGLQTFTWNSENRLASVINGDSTAAKAIGPKITGTTSADYLYDADGNLLIQRNPVAGTTTLYLPDEELTLNASTNTVTGRRYYTGPSGITAVRTGTDKHDYSYLITDPQGTATLSVGWDTQNAVWRDHTPYGTPRGPQLTAWPDTHAYLGKPTDSATGLDLLGARQYDPTLGRFISLDPLFDLADPNQIGGYTYSGDDPINHSDPSGLRTCLEVCGSADDRANQAHLQAVHQTEQTAAQQRRHICARLERGECDSGGGQSSGPPSYTITVKTVAGGGTKPQTLLQNAVGQPNPAWIINGHLYNREQLLDQLTGMGGHDQDYQLCALGIGCTNTMLFPEGGHPCGYDGDQAWCNFAATTGTEAGWLGLAEGAGRSGAEIGRGCSFDADTPVLMADGTVKAIKEIKAGDRVEATDPTGGLTDDEAVTRLHLNTDTDLADVIVANKGRENVVHTTQNHPFWDATTQRWTRTGDLRPGDALGSVDGSDVRVVQVRNFTGRQSMYNLTVSHLHTYYVLAGNSPVLVHNDDDTPLPTRVRGRNQPLTNKQAEDLATYLGYRKTNFRVRGQPVFTDGKKFISQDIGSGDGSHNGGTWKIANSVDDLGRKSTRLATTDALLNKIGC